MANIIDPILIDRMYALALQALRRKTSILQHILRYDSTARGEENLTSFRGDTVVIPIPAQFDDDTVQDVIPSNIPPVPNDIRPDYATVQLNNWKKVDYHLTDREVSFLQAGIMSDQFEAAMDALSRRIIRSIWSNFTGVYQYAGVAGTTPLTTNTAIIQEARRLLNLAGCPQTMRSVILNFDADANAIGLNVFQQYLQHGTTETLMEGVIRRALGFNWEVDGYLPVFSGGTLDDGGGNKEALINSATVAVGDTTVDIDNTVLTGTLVEGDLFTVAGDAQQYVVTGNFTAAGNAIAGLTFSPAAKVAWADDSVVTFVDDHALAGMVMHKQAFAFASRPLDNVMFQGGSQIRQMTDPLTGLSLCMEMTRQYKQTVAEFSLLWGSTLVRPECAVRLLG